MSIEDQSGVLTREENTESASMFDRLQTGQIFDDKLFKKAWQPDYSGGHVKTAHVSTTLQAASKVSRGTAEASEGNHHHGTTWFADLEAEPAAEETTSFTPAPWGCDLRLPFWPCLDNELARLAHYRIAYATEAVLMDMAVSRITRTLLSSKFFAGSAAPFVTGNAARQALATIDETLEIVLVLLPTFAAEKSHPMHGRSFKRLEQLVEDVLHQADKLLQSPRALTCALSCSSCAIVGLPSDAPTSGHGHGRGMNQRRGRARQATDTRASGFGTDLDAGVEAAEPFGLVHPPACGSCDGIRKLWQSASAAFNKRQRNSSDSAALTSCYSTKVRPVNLRGYVFPCLLVQDHLTSMTCCITIDPRIYSNHMTFPVMSPVPRIVQSSFQQSQSMDFLPPSLCGPLTHDAPLFQIEEIIREEYEIATIEVVRPVIFYVQAMLQQRSLFAHSHVMADELSGLNSYSLDALVVVCLKILRGKNRTPRTPAALLVFLLHFLARLRCSVLISPSKVQLQYDMALRIPKVFFDVLPQVNVLEKCRRWVGVAISCRCALELIMTVQDGQRAPLLSRPSVLTRTVDHSAAPFSTAAGRREHRKSASTELQTLGLEVKPDKDIFYPLVVAHSSQQ